jgi:hypothetical protein
MSTVVLTVHTLIAKIVPEMAISAAEASALATAIVGLGEAYEVRPDPKTAALMTAVTTIAVVYAPRAMKVQARRKEAARLQSVQKINRGSVPEPTAVRV